MEWSAVLSTLVANTDLTADQAAEALREILAGDATDAQIAAFLIALRMKGESTTEVSAMVDAMLEAAAPIELPAGPECLDYGQFRCRWCRCSRGEARQPQGVVNLWFI
jgi:anthranilate phosphoribosyltransferase